MKVEMFAQQVQDIHGRLSELYQGAIASVESPPISLLPLAFKELGTASEALQVAADQLLQQTEELAAIRTQIEAQRQRYQELFEFMPNAYLVTDAQGKILEANRAAAMLLKVEPSFLRDKLLVSFIPLHDRPAFRSQLAQLHPSSWSHEWKLRLQPRKSEVFDATVTVAPVRDSQGRLDTLRWIVRDISVSKQTQFAIPSEDHDPSQERSRHFYSKGEIIPLEPSSIWLVHRGLVKLITMSETGDEVMVGLASSSMIFGSSMTALPTYQATALSDNVELVTIPLSEISASPSLTQALLPQMTKRLRQTESLLAISGRRHVKDRLHHLLLFLKQEFGYPVPQGTRLSIRLTHQDLADACCTTRVTITRLLSQLQQQGAIAFDSKHLIILN
jgi:PAS domain S-box-containing protein